MQDFRTLTTQAFDSLTPLLKKVAEHLLQKPLLFSQETASRVSQEIGVSETTVIRFCTAIGFKGFSELQRNIRQHLYATAPFKHSDSQSLDEPTGFLDSFMNVELEQMKTTLKNINPESYQKAIQKILDADRILISGAYISFSMAHWLFYSLSLYTEKVQLFHPGTDNISYHLNHLGKDSLLIAFSFHPYALNTIWLSEELKKKEVYTISVTDSPIAPIVKSSDLHFQVESYSENSFETSPAAAYSVLQALVTGVEQKLARQKREKHDDSLWTKKFFV